MRTNIELEDALIREAVELSGLKTKRAVVNQALREFIASRKRRPLSELIGKIKFAPGYNYRKLRSDR